MIDQMETYAGDPCHTKAFPTFSEFVLKKYPEPLGSTLLASPDVLPTLQQQYRDRASYTSTHFDDVQTFMQLADQEVPSAPTMPSAKIRELRVRLLLEEVLEFAHAVGVKVYLQDHYDTEQEITFGELRFETHDATNLVEAVDGLADISVVTVGAFIALGVTDEAVLQEVDANNLAKFGPGGHKDENTGKWIKPPGHKPPDVAKVLRAQGWAPLKEE